MISKNVKLCDIPEVMWISPEIRSILANGALREPTVNVRDRLIQSLTALSERILHAESLLSKLDMDNRLERLESSLTHTTSIFDSHSLVIPHVSHLRQYGA